MKSLSGTWHCSFLLSPEFPVPEGWAWRRKAATTAARLEAEWGLLGRPQRPAPDRGQPPLTRGRWGGVPWSPGWRKWQSQHKRWWHSWLYWWWCCLCMLKGTKNKANYMNTYRTHFKWLKKNKWDQLISICLLKYQCLIKPWINIEDGFISLNRHDVWVRIVFLSSFTLFTLIH